MNSRAHRMTCRGFSIVEVLTVTAVAAVLAGIAVPQLPPLWAQFQIGGATRQIAIDLQAARMRAVGENSYYRIVFNADSTYVLQSSPDGATFANRALPVSLPAGIQFVGSVPQPTFNRLGMLADAASVTITNSIGQTKTVGINILGKITIS